MLNTRFVHTVHDSNNPIWDDAPNIFFDYRSNWWSVYDGEEYDAFHISASSSGFWKISEPFGGFCLILIGDFQQLPPVSDEPLYELGSNAYTLFDAIENVVQLVESQRQECDDPEQVSFKSFWQVSKRVIYMNKTGTFWRQGSFILPQTYFWFLKHFWVQHAKVSGLGRSNWKVKGKT